MVLYLLLPVLLGFVWEGYDPLSQTESELGVVDSPYGAAMNVPYGPMGLGVTIMAFAAAYHRALRPNLARQAATALLLPAGIGSFPCDAGCVDVTTTGRLDAWFSKLGAIGLPAAMVASLECRRAVATSCCELDGRMCHRDH